MRQAQQYIIYDDPITKLSFVYILPRLRLLFSASLLNMGLMYENLDLLSSNMYSTSFLILLILGMMICMMLYYMANLRTFISKISILQYIEFFF